MLTGNQPFLSLEAENSLLHCFDASPAPSGEAGTRRGAQSVRGLLESLHVPLAQHVLSKYSIQRRLDFCSDDRLGFSCLAEFVCTFLSMLWQKPDLHPKILECVLVWLLRDHCSSDIMFSGSKLAAASLANFAFVPKSERSGLAFVKFLLLDLIKSAPATRKEASHEERHVAASGRLTHSQASSAAAKRPSKKFAQVCSLAEMHIDEQLARHPPDSADVPLWTAIETEDAARSMVDLLVSDATRPLVLPAVVKIAATFEYSFSHYDKARARRRSVLADELGRGDSLGRLCATVKHKLQQLASAAGGRVGVDVELVQLLHMLLALVSADLPQVAERIADSRVLAACAAVYQLRPACGVLQSLVLRLWLCALAFHCPDRPLFDALFVHGRLLATLLAGLTDAANPRLNNEARHHFLLVASGLWRLSQRFALSRVPEWTTFRKLISAGRIDLSAANAGGGHTPRGASDPDGKRTQRASPRDVEWTVVVDRPDPLSHPAAAAAASAAAPAAGTTSSAAAAVAASASSAGRAGEAGRTLRWHRTARRVADELVEGRGALSMPRSASGDAGSADMPTVISTLTGVGESLLASEAAAGAGVIHCVPTSSAVSSATVRPGSLSSSAPATMRPLRTSGGGGGGPSTAVTAAGISPPVSPRPPAAVALADVAAVARVPPGRLVSPRLPPSPRGNSSSSGAGSSPGTGGGGGGGSQRALTRSDERRASLPSSHPTGFELRPPVAVASQLQWSLSDQSISMSAAVRPAAPGGPPRLLLAGPKPPALVVASPRPSSAPPTRVRDILVSPRPASPPPAIFSSSSDDDSGPVVSGAARAASGQTAAGGRREALVRQQPPAAPVSRDADVLPAPALNAPPKEIVSALQRQRTELIRDTTAVDSAGTLSAADRCNLKRKELAALEQQRQLSQQEMTASERTANAAGRDFRAERAAFAERQRQLDQRRLILSAEIRALDDTMRGLQTWLS